MDQLIKQEIAGIINQIQRNEAPKYAGDEGEPLKEDVSQHKFDIVDANSVHKIVVAENEGTAHYVNGNPDDTYTLRIIAYDNYLHRFIYDDGKGNSRKSRLKDGTKMSDYLVYNLGENKVYFIVHEISEGKPYTKIRVAHKQLSDTLNVLHKSQNIAAFINRFQYKICYVSAKDNRQLKTNDMAEGFNKIYEILPEPLQFNFGQIGTHNFTAYETSIIRLERR